MGRDKKTLENLSSDYAELSRILRAEPDRSFPLVAVASLETALGALLKRRFVCDANVTDALLERSLGSFSARIDAAHAIGLIDRRERRDLHLIRKTQI